MINRILKWLMAALRRLLWTVAILFGLSVLIMGWPWTPSDERMIEVLEARRPAFEALVAKVGEGRVIGRIDLMFAPRGSALATDWIREVRVLLRKAGLHQVAYYGPDQPMHLSYAAWGLFDISWYKEFAYRAVPLTPPPAVIDLHGADAAEVARAALCDPDRPAHLRRLCQEKPWVNDLDALYDHDEGGGTWDAERPIDEHWSLRMLYLR